MPGYRPRRDPLLRLASSAARRANVGTGSVGVSGVRGRADMSGGAGGANTILGELHQIDQFTVTDEVTDEFTLSHVPADMSWNAKLGWPLEDGVDFDISGNTLTVLDPADLFRGIDANGPRTLHVQYDYLFGKPVSLATTGTTASSKTLSTLSADVTFASPPPVGAQVLLVLAQSNSSTIGMSGLGATWSQLIDGPASKVKIYMGVGCDGSGTTVTASLSSSQTIVLSMVWVEGVTPTGALTSTSLTTTQGPLVAPAEGGIGVAVHLISGGTSVASETPGAWSDLPNAGDNNVTAGYIVLNGGESAGRVMTDTGQSAIAIVPNL